MLADLEQIPSIIKVEHPPTSMLGIVKKVRNLRAAVNLLAAGSVVTGYKFNTRMNLSHLVRETILPDDYLTLLVYLGMAAKKETTIGDDLLSTSLVYRKMHLESLLDVLKVSIGSLMQLQTKNEIFARGDNQLDEFVSALSENRMDRLIAWAEKDDDNNILELHFQEFVVAELNATLNETATAVTIQETQPPKSSKREDITIVGSYSAVVVELKKLNRPDRRAC